MKSLVLSLVLLCIVSHCLCQDGCAKPLGLLNCKTRVSEAGDDFCKAVPELRKCFVDDAQCSKEVWDTVQDATEKALGVKCLGCTFVPSAILVAILTLASFKFHARD